MTNLNNFFNLASGGGSIAEGYKLDEHPIVSLSPEVEGQRIFGFYICKEGKTKKGKTLPRKAILCGEVNQISLPERYRETFEGFKDDQKAALMSGRVIIKNIKKIDTQNGETHVFDLYAPEDPEA